MSKTTERYLLYNVLPMMIKRHGELTGKHKASRGGLNQRLIRSAKRNLLSDVLSSLTLKTMVAIGPYMKLVPNESLKK
jgi:hypothetical protein